VKRKEFVRGLEREGCIFLRHGKKHDVYLNPATGTTSAVPRHVELGDRLCRNIRQDLGLPPEPERSR
jgi:mRNA interferase HicA